MPYIHGHSEASVHENVRIFRHEGYDEPQAVAMALNVGRRAWKRAHPHQSYPPHLQGGRVVGRRKRRNRAGRAMTARRKMVCRCTAYGFPHQAGGGACPG